MDGWMESAALELSSCRCSAVSSDLILFYATNDSLLLH